MQILSVIILIKKIYIIYSIVNLYKIFKFINNNQVNLIDNIYEL